MNIFDFDGTLYKGDSTIDFWRYSIIRHPSCLRALPKQLLSFSQYLTKKIDKDTFKERFYEFLYFLPDTSQTVKDFWKAKHCQLRSDVLAHASKGDLVISASPEFLLQEICDQHGWQLIASKVDPHTGKLLGPNCQGKEKVARLQTAGYSKTFEQGYTNSSSDEPIMRLSSTSFLVRRHSIVPFFRSRP